MAEEDKGTGRGRGAWTAKGVQASQEDRIADLESQVEALSAAVFGADEGTDGTEDVGTTESGTETPIG